jgi:thiol-disulfide isomerase/thioredoxin
LADAPPTFTHRRERRGLVGPFSGRQLALAIAVVAVAGLVLVAVTTPLGSTGARNLPNPLASQVIFASPTAGLAPGGVAPEFAGTAPDGRRWQLTDLDGRPIRLADLRGKAVWIDFWASWCPPCQQETPIVRQVADEYRNRSLEVVAVQVQETVEEGRAYAQRYGLRYTIGADVTGDIFRSYRVYGLPTQFFLDADGVIRAIVPKPLALEEARAYIESVLPAGEPSASEPTASEPAASQPTGS